MNNRQINQHLKMFADARQGWIDILSRDNESVQAAQHILSINNKVELLRTMWNWADESIEPYR
jgi:hypothetical protein